MKAWEILLPAAGAIGWVIYELARAKRAVALEPATSPPIEIDRSPDEPLAFGYKTAWLAIRADDAEAVCGALGISDREVANWLTGMAAVHKGAAFVTPSVDGWVLVINNSLSWLANFEDADMTREHLERIGRPFQCLYYFSTDRVTECHMWARVTSGRVERVFAYLGETGEVLENIGQPTAEEWSFALPVLSAAVGPVEADETPDGHLEMPLVPEETHVLELARMWTIDPLQLPSLAPSASTGWLSRTWAPAPHSR